MISPLAVLLPAIVIGADSAAAAPAAGYTASLIPTADGYAFAVAVDSASNTTYVADLNTDELTVIDDANNTVSTTISLAGSPRGVAVDPLTDTIYVSLTSTTATNSPAVEAINGANPSLTQLVPLPSSSFPAGIAVDSTTKTVYVAEEDAAAVAVIPEGSSSVTTTVKMGSGTEPYQLAIDQTRGVVWVADNNSEVQAFNEASGLVTQTITLGGPIVDSIAVDPATSTVYAAIPADGLAVINETSGAVGPYINIAALTVAVDPGSGTVFASTSGGVTWIIDASSNSVVDTISRGGLQIAANTSTGSAYAAPYTSQNNAVWVLTPSPANAWSPVIKSTSATFVAGTSGSFAVVGSALPAATYSETGTLPSGITLSSSGVLSGTPAAGTGGSYPITLTAINGVAPDYSQPFTLTVDEAPAITSAAQTTFDAGVMGSFPMAATGYPPPTFSETGALPGGVILSTNGVLSGTPAAGTGGSYPLTITATNFTINGIATATQAFTLTVDQAPAFTSAAQAAFRPGAAGSFAVTATGFPAPSFSETGSLPGGVTLGTNGALSGTPAAGSDGSYPITITATNSAGSATQTFTLIVTSLSYRTITVLPVSAGGGNTGGFAAWAVDSAGTLWYGTQTAAGSAWTWTALGTGFQGTPAVVSADAGGLTAGGFALMIVDTSGNLWTGWQTSTGSAWHWAILGSGFQGTPSLVPADGGGLTSGGFAVMAVDTSGNLWTGWQTYAGSGWRWAILATGFQGTPALVPINAGGLTTGGFAVLAVDTSGNLWNGWQSYPGSGWRWATLASGFQGTQAVTVEPEFAGGASHGGFAIWLIDGSGRLMNGLQSAPGSGWTWTAINTGFQGTPAVEPIGDDGGLTLGFAVWAVDTTGQLWDGLQPDTGTSWTWTSLHSGMQGSPAVEPVDAGGGTTGGFAAWAVGTGGNLWNGLQSAPGSTWTWTNLGLPSS